MEGNLMKAQYSTATVCVDNHSDLSFVYMQWDQSSAKLMKSKTAIENYAKSHFCKCKTIMLTTADLPTMHLSKMPSTKIKGYPTAE